MRMALLTKLEITFFFGAGKKAQAFGLFEPIGLEFGKGRLGGTGTGDGDEEPAHVQKLRRVGLHQHSKMPPQQDAIVSLTAATGGNEAGSQRSQRGIGKGAHNNEAPGLGLAERLDTGKIGPPGDAAFPR